MLDGVKNKRELILFLSLTLVVLAQALWWIIFMARLTDEKVTIASQLGADEAFSLSTVREVAPVARVGDVEFPSGPVTASLLGAFRDLVERETA